MLRRYDCSSFGEEVSAIKGEVGGVTVEAVSYLLIITAHVFELSEFQISAVVIIPIVLV